MSRVAPPEAFGTAMRKTPLSEPVALPRVTEEATEDADAEAEVDADADAEATVIVVEAMVVDEDERNVDWNDEDAVSMD